MRDPERRGCLFMPPDYPGGPVSFDRDNGLHCLWPAGPDMASPRAEMRVGVDMRPRTGRGVPPPEDRESVSP